METGSDLNVCYLFLVTFVMCCNGRTDFRLPLHLVGITHEPVSSLLLVNAAKQQRNSLKKAEDVPDIHKSRRDLECYTHL